MNSRKNLIFYFFLRWTLAEKEDPWIRMVVVVVVGVPTPYSTRYTSHYKLAKFCPDETHDKGNAGN